MKFSMTCTCGDIQTVEATSREEAVKKFQSMMTPEAIDAHMKAMHEPGEAVPTVQQSHAMIAQGVQPA